MLLSELLFQFDKTYKNKLKIVDSYNWSFNHFNVWPFSQLLTFSKNNFNSNSVEETNTMQL